MKINYERLGKLMDTIRLENAGRELLENFARTKKNSLGRDDIRKGTR